MKQGPWRLKVQMVDEPMDLEGFIQAYVAMVLAQAPSPLPPAEPSSSSCDETKREKQRVRLLYDLTSYHPSFHAGVEGTIAGGDPGSDRFFFMRLDSGEVLKVLHSSAESI